MEIGSSTFYYAARTIYALFKTFAASNRKRAVDISQLIQKHVRFVDSWSEEIQFFGMQRPRLTDEVTIPIPLNTSPRRFRQSRGAATSAEVRDLKELDLLSDVSNYLILGDPGSGKTTTLKRLARHLLHQSPDIGDNYNFPIVVRARDLSENQTLSETIANLIGVRFEFRTSDEVKKIAGGKEFKNPAKAGNYVGDRKLEQALIDFLEVARAVLLIDGIDEVPRSRASIIEHELSDLGRIVSEAKLIVTCRSGDYVRQIEGFHVVEISSLEIAEVDQIVDVWAKEPEKFRAAIKDCPYLDLADRPLFLTQLIFVFDGAGFLPSKPSEVYRRITMLMLEKWDAERAIHRESRYAAFNSDQKLDFLAALAFHLTYKAKKKVFEYSDLVETYRAICAGFALPDGEAEYVASEIESHTGIIVRTSTESFEFCHLSLQEYLAAYHLVREPFSEKAVLYAREYPAPIAVAISLSSNASGWFAELFLPSSEIGQARAISDAAAQIILARIVLERPNFIQDIRLGLAVLYLVTRTIYDRSWRSGREPPNYSDMRAFIELPGIKESILDAESHYTIVLRQEAIWGAGPEVYHFSAKRSSKSMLQRFRMPLQFSIGRGFYTPEKYTMAS